MNRASLTISWWGSHQHRSNICPTADNCWPWKKSTPPSRANNNNCLFSRKTFAEFLFERLKSYWKRNSAPHSERKEELDRSNLFLHFFHSFSSSSMIKSVLWVVSLVLLQSMPSGGTSIGLIQNASLWFSNGSSHVVTGGCQECLCKLYLNKNFSSFNCYKSNQTCQMHKKADQNQSFQLVPSTVTVIYFLSLPTVQTAIRTSSCEQKLDSTTGNRDIFERREWFSHFHRISLVIRFYFRWSYINHELHAHQWRRPLSIQHYGFRCIALTQCITVSVPIDEVAISGSIQRLVDVRNVDLSSISLICIG